MKSSGVTRMLAAACALIAPMWTSLAKAQSLIVQSSNVIASPTLAQYTSVDHKSLNTGTWTLSATCPNGMGNEKTCTVTMASTPAPSLSAEFEVLSVTGPNCKTSLSVGTRALQTTHTLIVLDRKNNNNSCTMTLLFRATGVSLDRYPSSGTPSSATYRAPLTLSIAVTP